MTGAAVRGERGRRVLRLTLAVGVAAGLLFLALRALFVDPYPHTVSVEQGTYSSNLDTAVPGRVVDRDCGFSTPTRGGRTVWVFCDTGIEDPGQPLVFITSATAASAPAANGTLPVLAEALQGRDALPSQFIPSPTGDCPDKHAGYELSYWGYWTTGVTTLPDAAGEAGDTVLDFFDKVCVVRLGPDAPPDVVAGDYPKFVSHGSAVGTLTYGGSAGTVALRVPPASLHDLWPAGTCNGAPSGSYGAGPVVRDGYLYLYRAEGHLCARVWLARVRLDLPAAARHDPRLEPYEDAANYEYWNGSGWSGTEAPLALQPVEDLDGTGFGVWYLPAIRRFVMAYRPVGRLGMHHTMTLRTAPAPEGPWSTPVRVELPQCATAFCRAWTVHPELGDASTLWLGYFRSAGWNEEGRVRFATVQTAALP